MAVQVGADEDAPVGDAFTEYPVTVTPDGRVGITQLAVTVICVPLSDEKVSVGAGHDGEAAPDETENPTIDPRIKVDDSKIASGPRRIKYLSFSLC